MTLEQEEYQCDLENHIWNHEEPQPIGVPLLGHQVQLDSSADFRRDYDFVGRDLLINELLTTLKETKKTRGCYLISGFRGSGKTTLINKVLAYYKSGKTGPSWVPSLGENSDSASFRWGLWQAYAKLRRVCNYSQGNSAKLGLPHLLFRNAHLVLFSALSGLSARLKQVLKLHRVVVVKVNLGHDEPLSARNVMFDIAALLYQNLSETNGLFKKLFRMQTAAAVILVTLLVYYSKSLKRLLADLIAFDWGHVQYLIYTDQYIPEIFFLALVFAVIYFWWTRVAASNARVLYLLKRLNKRMAYTIEMEKGTRYGGFSVNRKETMPPLDARQIENELLYILKLCRKVWSLAKPDIVFVFDELDKIAHAPLKEDKPSEAQASLCRDLRERKNKVDHLLGAIKNFITHGSARFFFVAGREMLDSYQAERGSTSSLYESLFNRIFEVPSLLTDTSDHNRQRIHSLMEAYICRMVMDPQVAIYLWLDYTWRHKRDDPCWSEDLPRKLKYSPFCLRTYYHYLHFVGISGREARRIVLGLRNFIQFLTLHSWGNPKRMQSLFLHFTKPADDVDWRQRETVKKIKAGGKSVQLVLQFGLIDQQRIVLASNLYSQLYHDLGRQLASSGDKLAVSTMAAFQYVLKFYRYPFNRYHLNSMSETLSIYRSPELNTMVDTLLSKIFPPHIRRIRNSHYRYRFNGYFEQEMRYISRVSDIESAAFNFSLDAAAPAKAYYIEQLNELLKERRDGQVNNLSGNDATVYELCMNVGDLFALEQSHNEALSYYQMAVDVFEKYSGERREQFAHLYVEALLRLGEVFERRQSYDQAASVYLHACQTVRALGVSAQRHEALEIGDSKWDVFRQPYWAYRFLHLKRGPVPWRDRLPLEFEYPFKDSPENDMVNQYRAAQLAFFYDNHGKAVEGYINAIRCSGIEKEPTERATYIGAYSYLHLAESLFVGMMRGLGSDSSNRGHGTETLQNVALSAASMFVEITVCVGFGEEQLGLDELISRYASSGYFQALERLPQQIQRAATEEERKEIFLGTVNINATLGMMAHAATLLADRGMQYHASIAYLKIISLWGMLCESLYLLIELVEDLIESVEDPKITSQINQYRQQMEFLLQRAEKWVAEARLKAAESITQMTAGGYSRFQARWKNRDVVSWYDKRPSAASENGKEAEKSTKLTFCLASISKDLYLPLTQYQKKDFILEHSNIVGFELHKTLNDLFPTKTKLREFVNRRNKLQSSLSESINAFMSNAKEKTELEQDFIQSNIFEPEEIQLYLKKIERVRNDKGNVAHIQKDIFQRASDLHYGLKKISAEPSFMQRSMMGQNLIYLSIWEYMGQFGFRYQHGKTVVAIPHQTMVPHSTRSLIFAHWLAGRRYLRWDVLPSYPASEGDYRIKRKELYDSAAAAVHNLYKAIYYIRQLSGNDQDIMFPDPSMVLYDLWRLLYSLVKMELSYQAERPIRCDEAVELVKRELSSCTLRHESTPANFYDFNNVKRRAVVVLQNMEQLGDVSNRVRMDVLRTRHYLADDHEDPRFHLDWTMINMYSPSANVLKRYIKLRSEKLQ